jgi:DNA-binding MarR family transcriptional regulator
MNYTLDTAIGFQAERAVRALRRSLRRAFKNAGFKTTPYQYIVLYRLWESDGMQISQIASSTVIDLATLTRMIVVMERNGLVTKVPDQVDRRCTRIFVTDKGLDLKEKLLELVKMHHQKAVGSISEEELMQTERVLQTVIQNTESNIN